MNCPVCEQVMEMVAEDVSFNFENQAKEYVRTKYYCEADDTWVMAEIPKDEHEEAK